MLYGNETFRRNQPMDLPKAYSPEPVSSPAFRLPMPQRNCVVPIKAAGYLLRHAVLSDRIS